MSRIRWAGRLAVCTAVLAAGCGKADVNASCTMNGFGNGSCQFTNSGERTGSVCGWILVRRTQLTELHDQATLAKLHRLDAASSRAAAASSRESEETGVPVGETESWREWEKLRIEQQTVRNEALADLPSAESEMFCSGDVGSRETKSVDFTIPAVRELCDSGGDPEKSWRDICSFTFMGDA